MSEETPRVERDIDGQIADSEGQPLNLVAAMNRAEHKRTTKYLANEDPNAAINTQFRDKDDAESARQANLKESADHVDANLPAYIQAGVEAAGAYNGGQGKPPVQINPKQ